MKLRWTLLLPALLLPSVALAQSSPGWTEHQAVHAPEWNALWASKADVGSPPTGGPYLPLTGGTLVGPLTMSSPTISGGTWTNALLVSPNFSGSIGAISSITGMTGDQFNLTKNYSEALTGAPHQQVNLANLTVPAITQIWNNFDNLVYNVPGGDASPLSAVVTRYIQSERRTDAPLIPSWPLVVSSIDFTGHTSSVSGPAIGMELDLEVSGLDNQGSPFDANGSRSILTMLGKRGRNYVGTDSQIAQAVQIFSDPTKLTFKSVMRFSTGWSVAAIDTTGGVQGVSAATIKMAAGQTIAFDAAGTRTLTYDSGTGKLFFAVSGVNKFSIDASGNVKAAGTVTASTTP